MTPPFREPLEARQPSQKSPEDSASHQDVLPRNAVPLNAPSIRALCERLELQVAALDSGIAPATSFGVPWTLSPDKSSTLSSELIDGLKATRAQNDEGLGHEAACWELYWLMSDAPYFAWEHLQELIEELGDGIDLAPIVLRFCEVHASSRDGDVSYLPATEDPLWIEGQLAGLVYVTCVVAHMRQQSDVPKDIKDVASICLSKSWNRFGDLIHQSKAMGEPLWNGMHGRVETLLMGLAGELAGPHSPVPDLLSSWLAPASYPLFCPDACLDTVSNILGDVCEPMPNPADASSKILEEARKEENLWQETARFISATAPLLEEREFHAPFSLIPPVLQEGHGRAVMDTDLHTLADNRFQRELRSLARHSSFPIFVDNAGIVEHLVSVGRGLDLETDLQSVSRTIDEWLAHGGADFERLLSQLGFARSSENVDKAAAAQIAEVLLELYDISNGNCKVLNFSTLTPKSPAGLYLFVDTEPPPQFGGLKSFKVSSSPIADISERALKEVSSNTLTDAAQKSAGIFLRSCLPHMQRLFFLNASGFVGFSGFKLLRALHDAEITHANPAYLAEDQVWITTLGDGRSDDDGLGTPGRSPPVLSTRF